MYKKSIHTRFGYYDSSFSAAGDTEFKNRILKHINTKYINKTLGYFLNYPEERVTCTCNAEIEDIRAWYIFRTEGGVKYVSENKVEKDVRNMLANSLLYRKSFLMTPSTDYEYALNLSNYCLGKYKSKIYLEFVLKLNTVLNKMRDIESPNNQMSTYIPKEIYNLYLLANQLQKYIYKTEEDSKICKFQFNDNRYEQHNGVWEQKNNYKNYISLNGMKRLIFK